MQIAIWQWQGQLCHGPDCAVLSGLQYGYSNFPKSEKLREFDNAITGRLKVIPRSYLYPYPAGYDHSQWDRLSALIQAEFAFKDDFEYPYDLNYTVSKQSYILLNSLQFSKSDTSFYNSLLRAVLY